MPLIHGILAKFCIIFGMSTIAGALNSVVGGGAFLTWPSLLMAGHTIHEANICSLVAFMPVVYTLAVRSYKKVIFPPAYLLWPLILTTVTGSAIGAYLLILTPAPLFAHFAPYLVGSATVMFIWGVLRWCCAPNLWWGGKRLDKIREFCYCMPQKPEETIKMPPIAMGILIFFISIYGGYYGSVLAIFISIVLTITGTDFDQTKDIRNLIAAIIGTVSLIVFIISGTVDWVAVGMMEGGVILGLFFGALVLTHVSNAKVHIATILAGGTMTIILFKVHGFC